MLYGNGAKARDRLIDVERAEEQFGRAGDVESPELARKNPELPREQKWIPGHARKGDGTSAQSLSWMCKLRSNAIHESCVHQFHFCASDTSQAQG
jgi:hypothetical protein